MACKKSDSSNFLFRENAFYIIPGYAYKCLWAVELFCYVMFQVNVAGNLNLNVLQVGEKPGI